MNKNQAIVLDVIERLTVASHPDMFYTCHEIKWEGNKTSDRRRLLEEEYNHLYGKLNDDGWRHIHQSQFCVNGEASYFYLPAEELRELKLTMLWFFYHSLVNKRKAR